MSTGKIELSVGKIANKYEIFTEEEIYNINGKVPELDERVGNIEEDIDEINSSLEDITSDLEVKADKTYVDSAIESVDVSSQLANYATKTELGNKVDKIDGKGLSTNDYTTEEKNKLSGLTNYTHPDSHSASMIIEDSTHRFVTNNEKYNLTIAHTHSQSAHAPSDAQKNSDITKAEIEAKLTGNVSSHTHSQYLTEHQDISGKVDKVNGYSLVSDTEISRLATLENYDDSEIREMIDETNAKLEGGNTQVDLSDYAKKTDLHSHSNKTILDSITTSKVNQWDNKSNFSGNYNDLTNKPTIPEPSNYKTAYGTYSTAAATAEKAVVIDDPNWKLEVGNIIAINPSVSNSASNVKFNVNGTGAYPLWYNTAEYTSSSTAYTGYANRTSFYMFNGTHWVWLGQSYVASVSNASLGQGYAVCDTAESTLAKACTISSYTLTVGGIVSIKFTNAVPANSTLNIRTRGAKKIFYRGVAITDGIIKAGDIATFIYDDTQYHLISLDNAVGDIPTKTSQLINDSTFITKNDLPLIQQTSGQSTTTAMSQKAVTDYVNERMTELKGRDVVDSVDKMEDTTKEYVLASTGTIWKYREYTETTTSPQFVNLATIITEGYRMNSSGGLTASENAIAVEDYIDISGANDVIRVKGLGDIDKGDIYASKDTVFGSGTPSAWGTAITNVIKYSYDSNSGIATFTKQNSTNNSFKLLRVSGTKDKGATTNVIITRNEEIKYITETTTVEEWYDTEIQDNSNGVTIVQEPGDSLTKIMSQKAVTELVQNSTGGNVNYPRVDSIAEMTDTSISYILNSTNTIWSYVETKGDVKELYDVSKVQIGYRYSGTPGSPIATAGYSLTDYIPIDCTSDDPQIVIEYDGVINYDMSTQPYFNKITPCDKDGNALAPMYIKYPSVATNHFRCEAYDGKIVVYLKYDGTGNIPSFFNDMASVRFDVKHDNNAGATVMAQIKSVKCPTIFNITKEWTDTGLAPENANVGYVDLLVKITDNETAINDVNRRISKIESGVDTITLPSFWQSAVNECINKIKILQKGRNCITFPFFSDHHVRGGYVGLLIAKVMEECNIPYCVFGGDSISNGYMAGLDVMIEDEYKFKDLMSYIPDGRLLRVPGNHDGYCAISADERYYYTKDEIYDLFFRDIATQQNKYFDSDGTSLYADDLVSKVRFILLDTNKKIVNNTGTGKSVTDEQLSWLRDKALKFNETGWSIVFISHQPMSNHYHAYISNADEVYSLLNTYKSSSDPNKADIVGWFSGHIHRDRIWTGKAVNTSDDSQGDALPFIQVTISSDNVAISYDDATKHANDASDKGHCIDFVTINKNTRTVNITRLGIGNDRSYTY